MRNLLILLLIAGCSSRPLKYKYSFSKSYLSSLTEESVEVKKMEIDLSSRILFSSGIDSTFVLVKLYNQSGEQISTVDPLDLTLSTSEDIEAKPFSLKQGVYKAEILPRVKSPSIWMQVDWLEKMETKEIVLKTVMSPLKDELQPTNDVFETQVHGEVDVSRRNRIPGSFTERFSFENIGHNKIVNSSHSNRSFRFEYEEQARQNLSFEVHDAPSEADSQRMLSHFIIFPRKHLPTVEQSGKTVKVTLANGEQMIFQKESKEIVGGVFEEAPVDLSKNKFQRNYPKLKYKGKGILLRVNGRGQSPQLGQFEGNKIDMEYGFTGSVDVLIINGATGQKCRRPKKDFWESMDVSPIEFKFPTDKAFDLYLKAKCGFGLPKP